ncbi:hypothetical protein NQZ68_022048 [Dissostichus eleginoides]|nr:hypothetical protein NQZ68_022048 [Dissostichus eleginoides]
MDEFKRIKMSSLLILLLQFTGAAIGQRYLYLSVRAGDEATLPCNSVIQDQDECESTTWLFSDSGSSAAVELVSGGQVGEEARAKSDRLRVTGKCSLGIKKATEEDTGRYSCRQIRPGEQQGPDSQLYLSVVTMTEHQDNDEVTLDCSVSTYRQCRQTVKWLLQGRAVVKDHRDIRTSQSSCSASVTFLTSLFSYTTRFELFTCEVTNGYNVQTFRPQSSGEETTTTTESDSRSGFNTTASEITEDSAKLQGLLRLILVSVGLAALIMIVVAVSIWTRTKEKQTQMDEINVRYDVDDGTVNYENIRPPDGV